MLTDTALRNLKPKSKTYKAFDRDGMYVTVSPTGTVTLSLRLPSQRPAGDADHRSLWTGRYLAGPCPRKAARRQEGRYPGQVPGAGEAARETPADCCQELR